MMVKNMLCSSLKCVVLNKTVSNPNNKTLVKYELINEKFDTGIHLILWTNDISLDNNTLYLFKYITIDKYNNGWQICFNCFLQFILYIKKENDDNKNV